MTARWQTVLEQLVDERYPRLLARATLVVADDDAEDLVQDALVATFASRARFTHVALAEQYVRRAIVSRSIDRARTAASERRAVERTVAEPVPVVEIELPGLQQDVVAALRALTPRQRACVVLRHVEDLSIAETADQLGLSQGAVKRYTADGTAALQRRLDVAPPDDDGERLALLSPEEAHRD